MEYFANLRKSLQEQATVAASNAKVFADRVAEQARGAAQVAAVNAKAVAEKLKEDAKGLSEQPQIQEAAEKAANAFRSLLFISDTTEKQCVADNQLIAFGITSEYRTFVRSLDYSTFRDFNEAELDTNCGFLSDSDGSLRLNKWQEHHAVLALQSVQELDHLRYLLCPRRMTEEKFWLIYFSLAQAYLPDGCRTGELPNTEDQNDTATPSAPQTEILTKAENNEDNESANDDLDKYLNDVLHDDINASSSANEDFEDLEGYMKQLNDEIGTEKESSNSVEAVETVAAPGEEIQTEEMVEINKDMLLETGDKSKSGPTAKHDG